MIDRRLFLAALAATGLAGCRKAEGRAVRIINGSGGGSNSEIVLRMMVKHFASHGVSAAVENIPRGSGKVATRELIKAKRDGSVLGLIPTGLVYAQLFGEAGIGADLTRFEWLCSSSSDRRVLVVTERSGITRFEDLVTRQRPLICPAGSASGAIRYESKIITHLTGAPIRVVPGYIGGARLMSLISGETEGVVGTLDSLLPVLELKGSRIILRLNDLPIPEDTPGVSGPVPLLRDFTSHPDSDPLIALITAHALLGRIFALPPETPPGIVANWRSRFAKLIADPAYRKDAERHGYEVNFTDGASVAAALKHSLDVQRDVVSAALRRAVPA